MSRSRTAALAILLASANPMTVRSEGVERPEGPRPIEENFSAPPSGGLPEGWRALAGEWRVVDAGLQVDAGAGEARLLVSDGPWRAVSISLRVHGVESAAGDARFAVAFGIEDGGRGRWHRVGVGQRPARSTAFEYSVRDGDAWRVRGHGRRSDARDGANGSSLRVDACPGRVRLWTGDELVFESAFARDFQPGAVGLVASGCRLVVDEVRVAALADDVARALAIDYGPVRRVRAIAHRGSSRRAPENTLVAARLGIEDGADGVEFDVYRSADGHIVLLHDETLLRTTNFREVFPDRENAALASMTLDDLRRLDAGSWKAAEYRGEPIPTLAEMFDLLRGKATPVVEIKPGEIGRDVARAIRAAGMSGEVFVQSFAAQAIRDVRAELPEATTGFLTADRFSADAVVRAREHVRVAREVGANAVVCDHQLVVPEYVDEVHRRAMGLWVWTVDDPFLIETIVRLGVDGIISNVPAEVVRLNATLSQEPASQEPAHDATHRASPARPAARIVPLDERLRGKRVEVSRGNIPATAILEALAGYSGLAIVLDASAGNLSERTVIVPSDVDDADDVTLAAYLEGIGLTITRRRLASGELVLEVSSAAGAGGDAGSPVGVEPKARPIVVVGAGGASTRVERSRPSEPSEASSNAVLAGITFTAVPDAVAAQIAHEDPAGVLVDAIDGRDATDRGGLRLLERFDIVTRVDARSVRTPRELADALAGYSPGDELTIRLLRRGAMRILRTTR